MAATSCSAVTPPSGAARKPGEHLGLAFAAMAQVVVEHRGRILDHVAVAGRNAARRPTADVFERLQVVGHVPVGRPDHHGRPRHDVIARKEQPGAGQLEAEVVGRRARACRRPRSPSSPVSRRSPSTSSRSGAKAVVVGLEARRLGRRAPARRPGSGPRWPAASRAASGEWSTWEWVTRIQRNRSPTASRRAARCSSSSGPGSMRANRSPPERGRCWCRVRS